MGIMGHLDEFMVQMRVVYLTDILNEGLDVFYCGNSADEKYLFALKVTNRETRTDGSVVLRESDYPRINAMFDERRASSLKLAQKRVFPYTKVEPLDRVNLDALKRVARGEAVILDECDFDID